MSDFLPPNLKLSELNWTQTVEYLETIARSSRAVLVSFHHESAGEPSFRTRGHLTHAGYSEDPRGLRLKICWPGPAQENGSLLLYKHQFESASLRTDEDAWEFDLTVSLDAWTFSVRDTQAVASWPAPEPRLMKRRDEVGSLESLPTAEELREEALEDPENPISQEIARESIRMRELLVKVGAKKAGEMTVFEIQAASMRTINRLREEGVMPPYGDSALYLTTRIERLARDLIAAEREAPRDPGP